MIIPIDKWNKLLQHLFVNKIDEIPEWQKEEVNHRMQELEENPETAIDFDKMLLKVQNKGLLIS